MRNRTPSWALAAVLMALPAAAQIPPGFELVWVTNTPLREEQPRINNRGQIVYWVRLTGDPSSSELMLYDGGETFQLTQNAVADVSADINDDGTIVWVSAIGPNGPFGPTGEIMMYSNGVVTRLTNNADDDRSPRINNLGHVVWKRYMGEGCSGTVTVMDIFFYDGNTIRPITTDAIPQGATNQGATINDHDEITWARYDFCVSPWKSTIMLYSGGQTTSLSPAEDFQPQIPFINNRSQVAWRFYQTALERIGIYLWENGQVSLFTDQGDRPQLDDAGNLAFKRRPIGGGPAQAWLHRQGVWYQLTNEPWGHGVSDISGNGQVTMLYVTGAFEPADIRYLRRMPLGDLNCDGALDGADIDPFFLALGDPNGYRVAFPDCDPLLGDLNGDGRFDGADIDPFFDCLGAGGCP